MRVYLLIITIVLVFCVTPAVFGAEDHTMKPKKTASNAKEKKTILFVDDHDILYRSATVRMLNRPKRFEGNPIIKQDKPWEYLIAYSAVYRNPDTGKYQLWYQAYAGERAEERTQRCMVCYAESDDGIHFTKPNLGLFPFNGIKETNIVLIANGGEGDRYGNAVVVDPNEKDKSRRYKMAFTDFVVNDNKCIGLCVAFSPDGIHWTKYPKAVVKDISYGDYECQVPYTDEVPAKYAPNPLTMADAVDVFYDPVRKVYVNYAKMWIDGPAGGMHWKHAMGRLESKDFINWKDAELILTPDDQDPPYTEFHTTPVFYYNNRYFCLNQILNRSIGGGVIDVELMISRDGYAWDRPYRNDWFIPRGKPGQFDSGSIFTNSTPIVMPEEIRFYFGGYSGGAIGDDAVTSSGLGFVSIPLDRFAGIKPAARSESPTLAKPIENQGQITLKPLNLSKYRSITLNADASNGSIQVELLNDRGRRIHKFAKEDSVPIKGDSLAHLVKWNNTSLADLPPGKYMIRLHLDNATVYALSLSEEGIPSMRISQRTERPLIAADRPYEDFTLGWVSVIKDNDRWHMWYLCYDHNYKDDRDGFICYAKSKDGVKWEKPNLGLVEYNGSKENNIIFAGSKAGGIHGHSIFLDLKAPPDERFKMAYVDLVENFAQPGWWVYGATSSDGIHWKMIDKPLLKYNSDSQVSCFRDGDIYRLYVRMWSGALFTSKRIIGYTQSPTFGDFPEPRVILSPDEQDPDELQFYNSAVSKLTGGLYVMFPSAFYTKTGTVIPHIAYSRDGTTFTRPTHEPILPLGKDWDNASIYVAPGAIPADKPGSYWIYYVGGRVKHDDAWPDKVHYNGGFGRFLLEIKDYNIYAE